MELGVRDLDNDTRGWIMCFISGFACVFGASFICVDKLIRLIPGKRDFRIQDSNVFLSCSLSLSSGVMLFSALYSMLPESKSYLKSAGWTDKVAGLTMMAGFVGGFIGIQAVSRFLHQHMPSHVVDCDHTHDDAAAAAASAAADGQQCNRGRHSRVSHARRRLSRPPTSHGPTTPKSENGSMTMHPAVAESTPLLQSARAASAHATASEPGPGPDPGPPPMHASLRAEEMVQRPAGPLLAAPARDRAATTPAPGEANAPRRPSMYDVQKRVMSFVKDTKSNCDEEGPCYGYTDPCGQECFKHLSTRSSNGPRQLDALRTTTGSSYQHTAPPLFDAPQHEHHHHHGPHHLHNSHRRHHRHHDASEPASPKYRMSREASRDPLDVPPGVLEEGGGDRQSCSSTDEGADAEAQHHHHVPANAFLSIGLQTSIAIALHKFPEGFITFATNHANPTLGFNVFMALFVHNITEGFAMALPLFMALGSRWRALAWCALLGGLAQPLGAAVAALWFRLAKQTHLTLNSVAYACLFAVTSGIMVSVGLQLFVESLSLNHNRNLCIFFGFLGMTLLGVSNAAFAAE